MMANSQSFGAGDGLDNLSSTNWNADSPSPPWTNLALEVHHVLGSKIDTPDLRAMRLVCSEWKTNVEQSICLKVKVDDSIEGNLEFINRVKVGSARVLNWTADVGEPVNHLFHYRDWLKKLKLCGKMPAQWKIHNLCQFPNLAHLILRDDVLYLNNLTGHSYPVVNLDLNSDLSLEQLIKRAYEAQDFPTETQPIELKSMKTLEIVKWDYQGHDQLPDHLQWREVTNISFFLRYVKCPVLSIAHFLLNQPNEVYDGSLEKLNWMNGPLQIFLQTHRTSLRELFLPKILSNRWEIDENVELSSFYPTNLRKLELILEKIELQREDTFTTMQRFIQAQTQLKFAKLGVDSFPIAWIQGTLETLAISCRHTLRYLEFSVDTLERRRVFDLGVLSVCQVLDILIVTGSGIYPLYLRNVNMLPSSIRTLVFDDDYGGRIELGEPSFLKRLTKLKYIYLKTIRLQGDDIQQRQTLRDMFKDLLGLRKLKGFYLRFPSASLAADQNVATMLRMLGKGVRLATRYKEPEVRFHLDYSTSPSYGTNPWLSPFDEGNLEEYYDYEDELSDSSDDDDDVSNSDSDEDD